MLTDILELGEQTKLRGQVVVIGSGIAGSELATYLARHGREVILIESGRDCFEPSVQALNDVVFLGKRHRELNPNSYYHQYFLPSCEASAGCASLGHQQCMDGQMEVFAAGGF